MKKNNKAENLISILIGIAIMSIILAGTMKIIDYNKSKTIEYNQSNNIFILQRNTENIMKKINLNQFKKNDLIYLYKTGSLMYTYTGSTYAYMKYIDKNGNLINNTGSYKGDIYNRTIKIGSGTFANPVVFININKL